MCLENNLTATFSFKLQRRETFVTKLILSHNKACSQYSITLKPATLAISSPRYNLMAMHAW